MCSFGSFGDGVGEARFKKCSLLMGDVKSSEDEELMLMDWLHQSGLTLIRAVFRIGFEV